MRRRLRAPSRMTQLREQRVLYEIGALAAASPWLRAIGRGDRHPVLVLPGFMGDDASTVALRSFIRSWGYWAHGWRLGPNYGPTRTLLDGIRDRLQTVFERHGRPVSIVGWSAGGVFGRHLAREATTGGPPGDHPRLAPADARRRPQRRLAVRRPVEVPVRPDVRHGDRARARAACPSPRHRSTAEPTASCAGRSASTSPTNGTRTSRCAGSHVGLGFNPDGTARGRRSPGPARGQLAAVPTAAGSAPALPATRQLAARHAPPDRPAPCQAPHRWGHVTGSMSSSSSWR